MHFTGSFWIMHEFIDIKKVLVIKLRHIGDVLLSVPVFRSLRETFPTAHISALVNSGTEAVLEGSPLIDEIITFNRKVKAESTIRKSIKEVTFIQGVRTKGFDMAVDLTSGDRAAVLAFASGARYRLAYDPKGNGFAGKRFLYTHRAKMNGSSPHMVLQNLDVVRQFGITTRNTAVDIFIPDEAKVFVKKLFGEYSIRESDMVVHVHPTARWLSKHWRDESMAGVINWMIGKNLKVVITSSPSDREMERVKRILSFVHDHSRLVDLSGRTTIKQLAAISAVADLFVGVDTAPMHIAAAVGTPVIALFGPSGEGQWGPWGGQHTVLTKKMRCCTCRKEMCDGLEVKRCMEAITEEEVISAIAANLHLEIGPKGNRGLP
jgi:heptosyltransferase-3